MKSRFLHKKTGNTDITEIVENEYDHGGRPTKVKHGLNTASSEIIRHQYDEIGRLSQKKFLPNGTFISGGTLEYIVRPPLPGNNQVDSASKSITLNPGMVFTADSLNSYFAFIDSTADGGFPINGLQTVDFKHHIRGWLKGINLDNAGNAVPSNNQGDMFSYKLDYETGGFYDGNIGKQSWNNIQGLRSFIFQYDPSNRLKNATFTGLNQENYSLEDLEYDANGNILKLNRKGLKNSGYGQIDSLSYTYSGNRLQKVDDAISSSFGEDFKDSVATIDYEYYSNGNLKKDKNESIENIIYNTYLNQPIEIQLKDGRKIKNRYDGAGDLIETSYFSATDSLLERWTYVGNMIYKNNQKYQLNIPDGRVVFDTTGSHYEFHYTDHLGNVRLAFRDKNGRLEKVSETAFDPFGVVLKGLHQKNITDNRWELQGKERDLTFNLNWINFGTRRMNPTIGRMENPDIMASHPNQVKFSPYSAFWNNPILYTDPDGNCPSCPQGEDAAKMYSQGATVTNKDGSWTWTGKEWQTNQITQLSDKQVASAMPVNMAFGMGAYAGLKQTGQFLASLTTQQGWKDLGQGLINTARMSSLTDPGGLMMRAEALMTIDAYADHLPEMTTGEIAYDAGFVSEKVAEAVITRKVMPVTKASLGLRRGFGDAARNTNMISYGLKGRLGKLPFSVPTLMPKLGSRTSDVGIMLSRNFITPVGYGIGVGQFQFVQKRK